MTDIPIKKIMTTALTTIRSDKTVASVVQIFKDHTFHHVPVEDSEGSLVGIISRTDLDRIKTGTTLFRNPKVEQYNEVLYQTLLAKDIMTKGVEHLRPMDSIKEAYKIFKENKFRALPVIEKGKLAGIVTPLDILDHFFNL